MSEGTTVRGEGSTGLSLLQRAISLVKPHRSHDGDLLLRCQCGALMWKGGTKRKKRSHVGHTMRAATGGSSWEFIRMKLNLIH